MKKLNKPKFVKYQIKKEKKRLKRNRVNHTFNPGNLVVKKLFEHKLSYDESILSRHRFKLDTFLNNKDDKPTPALFKTLTVPKTFSFESNYSQSIIFLNQVRKSLFYYKGERYTIDFENCKTADFSGLFLLKVILDEYIIELHRISSNLNFPVTPNVTIKHSKEIEVNKRLLANAIISKSDIKATTFSTVTNLNLVTGRKNERHYTVNKKGLAANQIKEYINKCLIKHNCELKETGVKYLEGMIGEILNNAEDHSLFDRWYVSATHFFVDETKENNDLVSELNLGFLNFGDSIFEGLESTKDLNTEVYNEMNNFYEYIKSKFKTNQFSKENYFTLFALQEGKSRLKYIEESRGTGTMNFINSFLELCDYEDSQKKHNPNLIIYSGSTMLICDNKYKPFKIDNTYYLSLNDVNTLSSPPEESHLKNLTYNFPGTLLIGKIFLNEEHIKKTINDGN